MKKNYFEHELSSRFVDGVLKKDTKWQWLIDYIEENFDFDETEANIETFKQIARKYIDFDELTPEIINNLISHITVSHVKVINGTKFREIKIIYKFIG